MKSNKHNEKKLVRMAMTQSSALIACAWLVCASVHAAWVVDPSANVQTRYSDNMRSQSQSEQSGTETTLGVQAKLSQISEISEVSIMTGADFSKYSGVDGFEKDNRESFFLEGRAKRQLQRSELSLRTSFRRQDTLRFFRVLEPVTAVEAITEADNEDYLPGELAVEDELITGVAADVGSSDQLVQRNRFNIRPSFSYTIDPRTSFTLNYGFYDSSYSDVPPASRLQDSQSHQVGIGIRRATSPRNYVSLNINRSRFEPEFNLDSDSTNVQIRWQSRLSAQTTLTLSAGARKTETDFYDDSGGLFSGRIDHQLSNGSMFFLVERGLTGSGYGSQVENDRLSVGYSNELSDRVSWKISGRAFRTTKLSNFQQDNSRDFVQITPSIQWAFRKNWQVHVSYRYTWIDRDWTPDATSSNSVVLSMEYVPSRRP